MRSKALPPEVMGIGPIEAIPAALKLAGHAQEDIDLIEFNEAFAAQALAVIRELGLNPDIINVNGGAIALGHPLGCTGAKLTATLLHEMGRRKSGTAWSPCASAGAWGLPGYSRNCNCRAAPHRGTMKPVCKANREERKCLFRWAREIGRKKVNKMAETMLKGGEYLIAEVAASDVFTPEEFTDEQKQIGETTEQFVQNEIVPHIEEIDKQNFELVIEGMRKCGELGLLMMDAPEEYGGLELDKATSMLVGEKIAMGGSFSVAFAAHPASAPCRLSTMAPCPEGEIPGEDHLR